MEIKAILSFPVEEMTLRGYVAKHFGNVPKIDFDHPNMQGFLNDLKKDGKKLVLEFEKDSLPGEPFETDPAVGDRVIIPATVDGYGKDRIGKIIEIQWRFGGAFYTVHYDEPDEFGRNCTDVKRNQMRKEK
jgi:hypothetical protein